MKIKHLISFPVLEKYKYAYFVINSIFMAFITVLFTRLLMGENISLNFLILQFFICWGFMYPVSFLIFEIIKKQHKKVQKKTKE